MPEGPLPYGRQSIDEDDLAAVTAVLTSDYLTTGPEVSGLEADLAAVTGALFASVVSSGTAALHAAYAAIGLGPGDEVITSPLTFAATGNAALYLGARPVFVDIDARTGLLDPALVEAAITPQTKAIVPVDYGGLPADYDALRLIARAHGLRLIADAAHSLGATDRGRPVGRLADLTALSFHPVKIVTTGEGGAVLSDDGEAIDRVATFRTHGLVFDPERLEADEGPWHREMHMLGFNYRLTDIQCALGRSQLRKLPRFLARRRAIAARYDRELGGVPGITLPARRADAESSWHLYVIRVPTAARRAFFDRMHAHGIGVQVHYLPVYRHPYYAALGYRAGLCPRAEEFYAGAITIPVHPSMTDHDIERVVESVTAVARETVG